MDKRFLNVVAAVAVSTGVVLAAGAAAVAADPVEQVKQRETIMKKMGGGMQTVGKFVKGEGGTAADVQAAAAAIIEASTNDPGMVFPEGTAVGVSDSEAKPELWRNWPKAVEYWGNIKPAAARLAEAANSGDKQRIAQAMQGVGKVCGTCHEDFRVKKQ